jgi:hypothetical protein
MDRWSSTVISVIRYWGTEVNATSIKTLNKCNDIWVNFDNRNSLIMFPVFCKQQKTHFLRFINIHKYATGLKLGLKQNGSIACEKVWEWKHINYLDGKCNNTGLVTVTAWAIEASADFLLLPDPHQLQYILQPKPERKYNELHKHVYIIHTFMLQCNLGRRAQILGARSPWWLHFVRVHQHLWFPQYVTCFMWPLWYPESLNGSWLGGHSSQKVYLSQWNKFVGQFL